MSFQHAFVLGMVPSLFMLASTCIGLGNEIREDISGAMQHFAAGVLLCTVGTELLPQIVNAKGWAENTAAFIGFFVGVTVLILLGLFAPTEDVFEEDNRCSGGAENKCSSKDGGLHIVEGKSPTPQQKQQIREMKFVISGRKFRQRPTIRSSAGRLRVKRSMSLSSLPMVAEDQALIPSCGTKLSPKNSYTELNNTEVSSTDADMDAMSSENEKGRQFPLAFVLAVAIDSSLDGLLIGISSVAGPSAGLMMSASLSVEMGFLGLTLAATLNGQPLCKSSSAALVGPVCLVLSAGLGGMMADTLSHSPVAFIGMLSFGVSALLFMVAEELLLDAHESGEHLWWVDLQLYTGFFASIVAGKFAR